MKNLLRFASQNFVAPSSKRESVYPSKVWFVGKILIGYEKIRFMQYKILTIWIKVVGSILFIMIGSFWSPKYMYEITANKMKYIERKMNDIIRSLVKWDGFYDSFKIGKIVPIPSNV